MNFFFNFNVGFKFNNLEFRILQLFAYNKVCSFLHELMFIGFEYFFKFPETLNLEFLQGNFFIKPLITSKLHYVCIFNESYINFKNLLINCNYKKYNYIHMKCFNILNPISNTKDLIINTETKSNIIQGLQLSNIRGFISNVRDYNSMYPIMNNFSLGLNILEFIFSVYGTRLGILNTALNTSETGYLTRRLVESMQDIVIKELNCKSSNNSIIEIILDIKGNFKIYNFTYIKYLIKTTFNCISGRSICYKCLNFNYNTYIIPNSTLGILIGEFIGEPSTQKILKTFHLGGILKLKNNKNIKYLKYKYNFYITNKNFIYFIGFNINIKSIKIIFLNKNIIKYFNYIQYKQLIYYKNLYINFYNIKLKNNLLIFNKIYILLYNKIYINIIYNIIELQSIYLIIQNLNFKWILITLIKNFNYLNINNSYKLIGGISNFYNVHNKSNFILIF